MGAWGTGPFDNDEAMNLFAELEHLKEPDRVLERARRVLDAAAGRPGYLEVDEGNQAVAAALLVAAGATPTSSGSPQVDDWLSSFVTGHSGCTVEDQALALRALERVHGPYSEWSELWARNEHYPAIRAWSEQLRQALETPRTG